MKFNKGLNPPHPNCSCRACEEYHAKHRYSVNFKKYRSPRYLLLVSGFHEVMKNPNFFSSPDPALALGCSPASVDMAQHYLEAFQLIQRASLFDTVDETHTCKFKENLVPTAFGAWLFGNDPYLEDPASYWLLHYHLTTSPMALNYNYLFNEFVPKSSSFTRDELTDSFKWWLTQHTHTPSTSVIRHHINTALFPYTINEYDDIQDFVDRLFIDLYIIHRTVVEDEYDKKKELFYFSNGDKTHFGLTSAVFGYALFSFWETVAPNSNTIDIKAALWQSGSPLRAFKLTENQFIEYIEDIEERTDGAIGRTLSVNLNQIYRKKAQNPFEIFSLLNQKTEGLNA